MRTVPKLIRLPGYITEFPLDKPIIPGGRFYWWEATRFGERIPETKEIVDAIVAFARQLETARELLQRPMIITSWYRDKATNARVGGVRNSPHLTGRAVDFFCQDLTEQDVYERLHDFWAGGLGTYSATGHSHLDNFTYRRW